MNRTRTLRLEGGDPNHWTIEALVDCEYSNAIYILVHLSGTFSRLLLQLFPLLPYHARAVKWTESTLVLQSALNLNKLHKRYLTEAMNGVY